MPTAARRRKISRPSVPFKIANRTVLSLRDATLAMLDCACNTLRAQSNDEAVHTARKACKRIRAALRLLRDCLGAGAYRRENRRVRNAAQALTAVRDAFMLRRTFLTLAVRPPALRQQLESAYRRERRIFQRSGRQTALELMGDARERLAKLPNVESEIVSVLGGIRRVYKAGRQGFAEARSGADAPLHEWRKQAKYLLNELDLIGSVFDVQFKKQLRRAHALTETLGSDHDLGLLLAQLRRYRIKEPSLECDIKKRRIRLQARALRLGKRLHGHSPKDISRAVRASLSRHSLH
jgi:CHAD domain-containing protein